MFQITAVYDHPADPAAFDEHYDTVHAPLAKTLPGLQRFSVSRPGPDADGNPPAFHLVAVLEFASPEEAAAGLGGPEGRAAVADLATFAQAGVTMLQGPSSVL